MGQDCESLGPGSPPRVRGTVDARIHGLVEHGITPACAGNSLCAFASSPSPSDHPRVCGEQFSMWCSRNRETGSPPRVRGTVAGVICHAKPSRITPACAGNSSILRHVEYADWDHPRVCGEQCEIVPRYRCIMGSPPRVRGTVHLRYTLDLSHRITPACAGNSAEQSYTFDDLWDHPRVCGEQGLKSVLSWRYAGSPPRVRGTGLCKKEKPSCCRITPACAGNRMY